jgi:hypothetical protein
MPSRLLGTQLDGASNGLRAIAVIAKDKIKNSVNMLTASV